MSQEWTPPATDADSDTYEYECLPVGDYIRRLILEPGHDTDPLVGCVDTIRLEHADGLASYEAISYVWGSSDKDHLITINGKQLLITSNLAEVLRQVRLRDESRALWADSICINQKDLQEKGQQVGLMGQIYEKSSCTLICLGAKSEHEQHAKNAERLVLEVNMRIANVLSHPDFPWDWNCFPYIDADNPIYTDRRWASWVELVSQPWFFRGWVVQEAALGPDCVVLWAGMELPWLSILLVYFWVWQRAIIFMPTLSGWTISRSHSQTFTSRVWRVAKTFFPEHDQQLLENMSTLQLLAISRYMRLTEPKDRIYAFMALPTSDGAMPTLQPDYRQQTSCLDVYQDFAVRLLEQTSDLQLLSFVEHDDDTLRDAQLSSWIPRWDRGAGASPFFLRNYRQIIPNSQDLEILHGGSVLRARAIIFDSIVYTSETIQHVAKPAPKRVDDVKLLWQDAAGHLARFPNPHTPNWAMAFVWTLLQGSVSGEPRRWLESIQALARYIQSDEQASRPIQGANNTNKDYRDAQTVASHVPRAARDRRFMLLRRGYYGIASHVARIGDVCAVIPGAYTPFILRRVEHRNQNDGVYYKVVGAAWVHSKFEDPVSLNPCRLGQDEECEDWRDLGLLVEDIYLH